MLVGSAGGDQDAGTSADDEVSLLWDLAMSDRDAQPYLWPMVIFLTHAILGFTMFCVVAEAEHQAWAEAPSGGLPIWSPPRLRDPRIVQFGQTVLLVEMVLGAFVLWRFAEMPPWTLWWFAAGGESDAASGGSDAASTSDAGQAVAGSEHVPSRSASPASPSPSPPLPERRPTTVPGPAVTDVGNPFVMAVSWHAVEALARISRPLRVFASRLPSARQELRVRDLELICVALCGVAWVWSRLDGVVVEVSGRSGATAATGTGEARPAGAAFSGTASSHAPPVPPLATSASYLLLTYMILFSTAGVAALARRRFWRMQYMCLSMLFACGISGLGRTADTQWILFVLMMFACLLTAAGLVGAASEE